MQRIFNKRTILQMSVTLAALIYICLWGVATAYAAQVSAIRINDKGDLLDAYTGTGLYQNGKTASIKYKVRQGKNIKNWLKYDGGGYTLLPEGMDLGQFTVDDTYILTPNADYNISYNLNGGTGAENTTYDMLTDEFTLPQPVREGYEFTGYTGSNGNTPQKIITIPKYSYGDREYTANWNRIQYTVHFNMQDKAGQIDDQTVYHGDKAVRPDDPVNEAYNFKNWYMEKEYENVFDFNKPITKNTDIYSDWEKKSYQIIFNTNGGSAIDKATVYHGDKLNKPQDPTREGYDFIGWYKDTALEEAYDFNDQVTGSFTINAKWSLKIYTVNFNSDGGTPVPSQEVEHNAKAERPDDPVKTGYTFTGWYSDSDRLQPYNFTRPVTGSFTLYAGWDINKYTVSFDTDGGSSVATQTIEYNKKAEKPADPEKTGYTFEGWYSDSAKTKAYSFNELITENKTIYAKWTINTYTVTFESNGGSEVASQPVTYNNKATEPADPVKTGHIFKGWYTESGLTNAFDFDTLITGNRTLYAKWEINKYTVAFNSNGGSTVASQTVEYNQKAAKPAGPSKAGHTFKGWYTESGLVNAYDFDTLITENRTLYAKWEINTYTVTFNSDGGSSVASQTITYNQKAAKPADPTKTGYTFKGWYTENSLTNAYDFNAPITGNRTLYAKWEINKYTVTFNTNGGGAIQSQTITYNQKATKPVDPVKTGYAFKGWYKEATFVNIYDFDTPVTADVALYAKWEINKYTVAFNSNGGSTVASQTIEYNQKAAKPSDPTKAGHTFKGWYTESGLVNAFNFNTLITENKTLYAKWELNTYTVTFNTDGGSSVAQQTVTYNNKATKPANPTKEGHTFINWYTESGLVNVYDFNTLITANRTLYAKWEIINYTITFDNKGVGVAPAPISAPYGSQLVMEEEPSATGYTFNGWFTDTACTTPYDYDTLIDKDFTLYAKWTPITYTVQYEANAPEGEAASGTMSDSSFQYGQTANLTGNAYRVAGYGFMGWNTKADGSGISYDDKAEVKNLSSTASAIILYAQWMSAKTSMITTYNVKGTSDIIGGYTYKDYANGVEMFKEQGFSTGAGEESKTIFKGNSFYDSISISDYMDDEFWDDMGGDGLVDGKVYRSGDIDYFTFKNGYKLGLNATLKAVTEEREDFPHKYPDGWYDEGHTLNNEQYVTMGYECYIKDQNGNKLDEEIPGCTLPSNENWFEYVHPFELIYEGMEMEIVFVSQYYPEGNCDITGDPSHIAFEIYTSENNGCYGGSGGYSNFLHTDTYTKINMNDDVKYAIHKYIYNDDESWVNQHNLDEYAQIPYNATLASWNTEELDQFTQYMHEHGNSFNGDIFIKQKYYTATHKNNAYLTGKIGQPVEFFNADAIAYIKAHQSYSQKEYKCEPSSNSAPVYVIRAEGDAKQGFAFVSEKSFRISGVGIAASQKFAGKTYYVLPLMLDKSTITIDKVYPDTKACKLTSGDWTAALAAELAYIIFDGDTAENSRAIESHTVNFDTNGAGSIVSQTIEDGQKAVEPDNPTKTDNAFGGWYKDSELTVKYNFDTPVTDDITLYAKWTPTVQTFTIYKDGNFLSSPAGVEIHDNVVQSLDKPDDVSEFYLTNKTLWVHDDNFWDSLESDGDTSDYYDSYAYWNNYESHHLGEYQYIAYSALNNNYNINGYYDDDYNEYPSEHSSGYREGLWNKNEIYIPINRITNPSEIKLNAAGMFYVGAYYVNNLNKLVKIKEVNYAGKNNVYEDKVIDISGLAEYVDYICLGIAPPSSQYDEYEQQPTIKKIEITGKDILDVSVEAPEIHYFDEVHPIPKTSRAWRDHYFTESLQSEGDVYLCLIKDNKLHPEYYMPAPVLISDKPFKYDDYFSNVSAIKNGKRYYYNGPYYHYIWRDDDAFFSEEELRTKYAQPEDEFTDLLSPMFNEADAMWELGDKIFNSDPIDYAEFYKVSGNTQYSLRYHAIQEEKYGFKTKTDPAYATIAITKGTASSNNDYYTNMLYIGKTADSVAYKDEDNGNTYTYNSTFTYKGETWYVATNFIASKIPVNADPLFDAREIAYYDHQALGLAFAKYLDEAGVLE